MDMLGYTVRDSITGIQGIAQAYVTLINGNGRYNVQPPAADGKIPDCYDIDEHSLEIVKDAPRIDVIAQDAGITIDLGDAVRDLITGRTGIVHKIVVSINGCTYIAATQSKEDLSKNLLDGESLYDTHQRFEVTERDAFSLRRRMAKERERLLSARPTLPADTPPPPRPTGGPTTRGTRI